MRIPRPRIPQRALYRLGIVALAAGAAGIAGFSLHRLEETDAVLARPASSRGNGDIAMEQRRQAATLAAAQVALDQMRQEVALLRAGFDAQEERQRHAMTAANKRIDWLETLVYGDATGSIRPNPEPNPTPRLARGRHGPQQHAAPVAQAPPGWFVLYAESGLAVLSGRDGMIDVTPGFVIPELGRVSGIRQEGDRWIVVTDSGTIRER
jgi:hypothetical protein